MTDFNEKQIEILQVAEKLFAEEGFDGTSVRDIAKKANINIAMISYYFGSKEKLLEALVIYRIKAMSMHLENLYQENISPLDKMDKLISRQGIVQDKIDALDAWELDQKLDRAMDALRCPPDDQLIETLSGGERDDDAAIGTCGPRRVARVFGGLHRSVAEPHVGPVSGCDARSVGPVERGL